MPENTFSIWEGAAPGSLGSQPQDIPTLTFFAAKQPCSQKTSLLIFPGGGYQDLADHEGKGYADFFTEHGISCFVLKYRLGSAGYRHPVMLQDAEQAIRLIRSRSTEFNIDPQRVGIIGSSAGGHLASTLLTHFSDSNSSATNPLEKISSRPDFGILCYPVITMGAETHEGSRKSLLGPSPSHELVKELSCELHVTPQTPPCFIWHTGEDKAVKMENSMMFANSLRTSGVPFDLHIYQKGHHGIGLGENHPWSRDAIFWLTENGLI